VPLHDEVCSASGIEPIEPLGQDLVNGVLANPDRRIRPNAGKTYVAPHVIWRTHSDIFKAQFLAILLAELTRPTVHVNGPYRRLWRSHGHGDGNWPVSTTEIEEMSLPGRRGNGIEQNLCAEIETVTGKHASIGHEFD
jgi:hypothetical protein